MILAEIICPRGLNIEIFGSPEGRTESFVIGPIITSEVATVFPHYHEYSTLLTHQCGGEYL